MSRQPRVTAAAGVKGTRMTYETGDTHTSPSIEVLVEFDHGSHDEALDALREIVGVVTRQIEGTRPEDDNGHS